MQRKSKKNGSHSKDALKKMIEEQYAQQVGNIGDN